jgi:transcriptional regulator with XRE-family HTH domain
MAGRGAREQRPDTRKTAESITLGRRLKSVRDEQGLEQKDVAEVLGMSEASYGFFEQGRSKLQLSRVPRFAAALRVEPGYLADRLMGQPPRRRGEPEQPEAEDPRLRSIYVQLSNGLIQAQPRDRSFVYRALELFAQRFGLGGNELHEVAR